MVQTMHMLGRTFTQAKPNLWVANDAVAVYRQRVISEVPTISSYQMNLVAYFSKRALRVFEVRHDFNGSQMVVKRVSTESALDQLRYACYEHPKLLAILREKATQAFYFRHGKFPNLESMLVEMSCPWMRELPVPVEIINQYLTYACPDHTWRQPTLRKFVKRVSGLSGDSVTKEIRDLVISYHQANTDTMVAYCGSMHDFTVLPPYPITADLHMISVIYSRLLIAGSMGTPENAARFLSKPVSNSDQTLITRATILRLMLVIASPALRRRLIEWMINNSGDSDTYIILADAWDMIVEHQKEFAGLIPVKPKSPTHFHDEIVKIYNEIDARKNLEPIVYSPLALQLDGLTITGNLVVHLAKDTGEIRRWGREMNHCIGSYANRAAEGSIILGALYENGEMAWNFELDLSGRLVQVNGKCNKIMQDDERKLVQTAISEFIVRSHGELTSTDKELLHRDNKLRFQEVV